MQFKSFIIIVFSFVLLIISAFYLSLNSSYQRSMNAKMYYYLGEYENALIIAKEAYELNKYNKMAYSIMQQSEISIKYKNYIDEANEYYDYIKGIITTKSYIDKSDRYRIKLMSDIVMDKYSKLNSTRITDKDLVNQANKLYNEFKVINEKINEKI